jgi:AAA15 family ATPase/GTPase
MLVEFTVGNYRSFKEPQTLSLEASSITEFKDNISNLGERRLLKTVGVYGSNGSGKSNLLKAIDTMQNIIRTSAISNSDDQFNIEPFALVIGYENKPTLFEGIFAEGEITFKYGFEITKDKIWKEYLYQIEPENKELFERTEQKIDLCNELNEVEFLTKFTKPNTLFLSLLDQFNIPIMLKPIWLALNKFSFFEHGFSNIFIERTTDQFDNIVDDEKLNNLIKNLDLSIYSVGERVIKTSFGIESIKKIPTSKHKVYNDLGEQIGFKEFELNKFESAGIKKLYNLGKFLLNIFDQGNILIIDEIEEHLHLFQTLHIISMFNSNENTNGAQLIFTTHDTNLLTHGELRRDQIYFTEKSNVEATILYSLAEFKEEGKKTKKFQEDYLKGRYGAIPFIKALT